MHMYTRNQNHPRAKALETVRRANHCCRQRIQTIGNDAKNSENP